MVTVIIPVYNTEEYIERSIRSVLNQTYRDWELIVVNDGSTDSSGKICESMARLDERIIVLNQNNSGQGCARNNAMKIAKGDYFAFLDSDDYWDKTYLEEMVALIKKYDADISICAYRFETESGDFIRKSVKYNDECIKEYSGLEAARNILYWIDYGAAPWAKLFKRKVWENLSFPEDRIYEDLAITYRVCLNSQKVVFTSKAQMSYVLRANSDIRMNFNCRKLRVLDTADEILEFAKTNNKDLLKAAKSRIVATSFFILFQMPNEKEYQKYISQCQRNIRKYRLGVGLDRNARKKTRLGALLSFCGFPLTKFIFDFFKKKDASF